MEGLEFGIMRRAGGEFPVRRMPFDGTGFF